MSETTIRNRLIKTLKKNLPKAHIVRISDAPFLSQRPYDFYVFTERKFFAIEVKDLKASRTLNINILRPHQIRNLLSVSENGGVGLVIGQNDAIKKKGMFFRIGIGELVKLKRVQVAEYAKAVCELLAIGCPYLD